MTAEEIGAQSEELNLREIERRAIRAALERTGGNVSKAAKLLGVGRATLYRRIAKMSAEAPPASGAGE